MTKGILFNQGMVRAILDGRKTVTRRVIKVPPYYPHFYKLHDNADGAITGTRGRLYAGFYNDEQIFYINGEKRIDAVYYQAPYQPGDILYVRETWWQTPWDGKYHYLADSGSPEIEEITKKQLLKECKCRPSIHMPKEAARIWLRVTGVRVERLQDCGNGWCLEIEREGVITPQDPILYIDDDMYHDALRKEFQKLWDSTIKKSDLGRYGWAANPWVWVITFERCGKPEGRAEA